MNNQHLNIFLAELLTLWESKGNRLDVRQYLQIQTFVQQLPEDLPLERLKSLLAPLLTLDESSQQAFYEMFDEALPAFEERMYDHEKQVKKIQNREKVISTFGNTFEKITLHNPTHQLNQNFQTIRNRAIGIIGALVISFLSWVAYDSFTAEKTPTTKDRTQKIYIKTSLLEETEPLCLELQGVKKAEILLYKNPRGVVQVQQNILKNGICIDYQSNRTGREIVTYKVCYPDEECFFLQIFFHVVSEGAGNISISPGDFSKKITTDTVAFEANETGAPLLSDQSLVDTAFMTQQATQAIEGVTNSVRFGGSFTPFTPLKGLAVGIFALLIFVSTYLYKRIRQRFSIHQNHPPESYNDWSIEVPHLKEIDFGLTLKNMIVAMRKRVESEALQLDMASTIEESIYQGGAISFQYKNLTQNQQYLALIDLSAPDSHLTKLYTEYVKALQEGDAPLDYFFFDKNTVRVWNNRYPKGLNLKQLQHKFGEAQLFVFSDGNTFLENTTWLQAFANWRRRALLTSRPIENWSTSETNLKAHFRLLPATPLGLKMLIPTLEAVEPKDYETLGLEKNATENYTPLTIPEYLSSEELEIFLEKEFINTSNGKHNDKLLRWIAACALPPTLFWEWTLHIGQLLSTPSSQQITLENLLQINRLPWFKTGQFPEKVRTTLLFWLEKNHPAFLDELYVDWGKILEMEENVPPIGSIAWQGHRLQVILNELLQRPNKPRRKDLEQELETLMADHHRQDALIIKYMEQRKSPLDPLLSNRFRPFLQKQEPLFWRWRSWTWQMPTVGAFFIFVMLLHYNEPVTTFNFDNAISELSFVNDGENFLIASGLSDLSVCSMNGNFVQGTTGQRDNIVGLGISADGNSILSGTTGNDFAFWDISGAPTFLSNGTSRVTNDIAFHPINEKIALIGYYANQAELWNIEKGEKLATFPHRLEVTAVAFSNDGKYVLTGSRDNTAKLWTVKGELLQTLEGHNDVIHSVAFSADNQQIATGSRDNSAKIWDFEGKLLLAITSRYDVFKVQFSPDGKSLFTGSINKAALWSVETGQRIRTLGGHYGYVRATDFSEDGQRIVTGDSNGKVKLWWLEKEN